MKSKLMLESVPQRTLYRKKFFLALRESASTWIFQRRCVFASSPSALRAGEQLRARDSCSAADDSEVVRSRELVVVDSLTKVKIPAKSFWRWFRVLRFCFVVRKVRTLALVLLKMKERHRQHKHRRTVLLWQPENRVFVLRKYFDFNQIAFGFCGFFRLIIFRSLKVPAKGFADLRRRN